MQPLHIVVAILVAVIVYTAFKILWEAGDASGSSAEAAGYSAMRPPAEHPDPVVLPPGQRSVSSASPIQVRGYWLAHSDAALGPDDPDVFYDQIHLDLHDPRDGEAWQAAYVVATPKGLERALEEDGAPAIFEDSIVVVPRYDLSSILEVILKRIEATWQNEPAPPASPEPPLL